MLTFTGERYIPSETGEIRLEHYHRYVVAQQVAQDKIVLDLACGEGYGAALLSTVAQEVVGVDLDPEAIDHARATYGHLERLRFECCDGTRTRLPDASFDVVVSFETIEHVAEQEALLNEIRRVLKPEGILIISSPNRPIYSDARNHKNAFHVRELDHTEFDKLLKVHYEHIQYYGQRLIMGTVIQPLATALDEYTAYSDNDTEITRNTFLMHEPMYYIATCTCSIQAMPSLNASIFIPNSIDLIKHYVSFANWAKKQDSELGKRDQLITQRNSEIANLQLQVETMNSVFEQRKNEINMLNLQLEKVRIEVLRAESQLSLLKDLYQTHSSENF
jgi:ubiquinone/menaquinone biosynthesis C-methylase UbiE